TAPAGADGATDTAVTGTSSAAYHATEEAAQKDSKTAANNAQKKGIVRAWLLAGAARWGKGGGTQNKRLDMKKAKAQAQQVKETRQVSINRSSTPFGRGSSASGANGAGGKSLNSKGNSGGAVKGPKNSNGKAHQGPAGRSGGSAGSAGSGSGGSGGRGPSGGRATDGPTSGRNNSASTKDSKTNGGGRAPKPEKTSLTKGGTTNSPKGSTTSGPKGSTSGGSAGGKSGAPGPAGSAGKSGGTGKSGGAGSSGSSGSSKGSGPGSSTTGTNRKGDKTTPASASKDTSSSKDAKQAPARGDQAAKGKDTKPAPATDPAKTKTDDKAKVSLRKLNLRKGKTSTETQAGQKTTQTNGKPFSVRASRETGYRDGTRAAKVAAHTKAYRDGVKDGWADVTQVADRQKARLDQAHQARKQDRDKEQPVTGTQSSADYHQPQPIGVKEVTASHVVLGDGAAKDSMSRGEVRSLKGFERRLGAKSDAMTKVAETTKGLQAHAEEQAKKATKRLEDAKAVKGGEKLASALTRLEEAAKIQADKAKEIHKRAVRAAEACAVVLANAETRYGGMYKAVVDSDETAPAELHFYKG
ncbi:hypothetical protein, partial [Streptomyces sp. NPDC005969]|uniref:hypothetical protein n=1 Tax=Streptomyces sp. NPDC005969 TaxID=3156722 RepID=UPI0034011DE1